MPSESGVFEHGNHQTVPESSLVPDHFWAVGKTVFLTYFVTSSSVCPGVNPSPRIFLSSLA